jgi:hypothetical protein
MKRFPPWSIAASMLAVIVVMAVIASWQILGLLGLPLSKDEYNLAVWEVQHFPNKWLYLLGHIGSSSSREDENVDVLRYLQLQRQIDDLNAQLSQESATKAPLEQQQATMRQLDETRNQRDSIANRVEVVLEGRISAVASGLGIQTDLPLFSGTHWLFPPIDFEFEDPPYLLVISPRDKIEEEGATLLRSDLSLAEAERLEAEAEAKSNNISALVVPTGGIGAYPAIIEPTDDYLSALQVASHEWTHDYLYFHPLGARYFVSDTLRTINETVADIVGTEMGSLVEKAYPLPTPAASPTPAATPQGGTIDVDRVLRQLRTQVDQLLKEGKVPEAEALMDQTQQYLADHGYYFRKINQAFFAFYGLYGTSGASSSPIGPELEELRQKSGSLGEFIRTVQGITSENDLNRLAGVTPTPTPAATPH